MQAGEPLEVTIELHSLRQELKNLHKEVDILAQGTDHPEVKRFARERPAFMDTSSTYPVCACQSVGEQALYTCMHRLLQAKTSHVSFG